MTYPLDADGSPGPPDTRRAARPGTAWTPLRIIIVYVLISGLWILVSDQLVATLVSDPGAEALFSTLKGWGFILVTAWLLFGMIQRYTRSLEQAQATLQDREAWYRRLITTAEEGIWVLDQEHRVTFANHRLAEMLGYDPSEICGHSILDFIDPACRADVARHLEARDIGLHEIYESRLRCKDGAERWVIASATPILDERGHQVGSFAMLTDITERHQIEAFQREFARKLIEAATDGKLLIRTREEIMAMAGPPIMQQTITRPEDLEQARHAVAELAEASGMDDDRAFDLVLAISEATTNAMKHAGGGVLSLHRVDDTLLAVICDRGPGINTINLPEVALKRGYTTAVSLGMGYKAMISITDHVYLATGPEGTTVAIAMGLHAPPPPPVVTPALSEDW